MNEPTTEDLQKLRGQLQEEIREARGILKDLRYEIKTARELVPLLTEEMFAAEVKKHVEALGKVTDEAMQRSVEKVIKSFDKLRDTLMGQDRTSVRKGRPSIPTLLENPKVIARVQRAQGQADRE